MATVGDQGFEVGDADGVSGIKGTLKMRPVLPQIEALQKDFKCAALWRALEKWAVTDPRVHAHLQVLRGPACQRRVTEHDIEEALLRLVLTQTESLQKMQQALLAAMGGKTAVFTSRTVGKSTATPSVPEGVLNGNVVFKQLGGEVAPPPEPERMLQKPEALYKGTPPVRDNWLYEAWQRQSAKTAPVEPAQAAGTPAGGEDEPIVVVAKPQE